MNNTLYQIPRILAILVMIGLFSLIGIGNPIMLPIFAVFFTIVFAVIYFLHRTAVSNREGTGTSSTAMRIMQIISVVVFIGVLSLIGLMNNPLWIPVWAVLITAISVLIWLSVKNRQRHSELTSSNPILKTILAAVLAGLAILLPFWIAWKGNFIQLPEAGLALFLILSLLGVIVFAGLMLIALHLINRKGSELGQRVVGYLLIIVASFLPGLLVTMADKTTTAIAGAYLASLLCLLLIFNANSLIRKKD